MSIRHHPSQETLLRYAAGTLPPGPALVVATHVEVCPLCRGHVADFEAAGGQMLESLPPSDLSEGALDRILHRIEGSEPPPLMHSGDVVREPLSGLKLPHALRNASLGPWRWLGPGIRRSRLAVAGGAATDLVLYRIAPGRRLPAHGHSGTEITQVLTGSFSDNRDRYAAGDLVEVDSSVEHQPIVDQDEECICLAAVEGRLLLSGLLGRLVQRFVAP